MNPNYVLLRRMLSVPEAYIAVKKHLMGMGAVMHPSPLNRDSDSAGP